MKINKTISIIICEDEKSSHLYLNVFKQKYRRTARIEVAKYKTLFGMINEILKLENNDKVNYDNKFCVLDLDIIKNNDKEKQKYNNALKKAKKNNIKVINCDPNFEYYLLLHYEHTNSTNKTEINTKLKKHTGKELEEIKKDRKLFQKLIENKLDIVAIENNKKSFRNNYNQTNFYEIIEFLKND